AVVQLRRSLQEDRLQGAQEGPPRADDRIAGLVAGRLRQLRPAVLAHGLARGGYLPHRRWPWRRRHGPAALRAAQQLARQRAARSRAPLAVADQEKVWQPAVV